MKTFMWYAVTVLSMGAAATVSGQSDIPGVARSSSGYIQATKLVGSKVKSSEGEKIGIIKDVVIDRTNGCMAYTIVSTGGEGTGVSSGGGKIVAVPWAVYSPASDSTVLTIKVSREKVYNAPAFDYQRMDEYARPDYSDNVYSYYGVGPGPRTAPGASSGATAGTDVTGTAGATASPGEVASPSADTGSGSAASPDGDSSEHVSPTQSASTIHGRPAKGRQMASPGTREESASESTSSNEKKTQRKAVEGGSTHSRTPTPEAAEDED